MTVTAIIPSLPGRHEYRRHAVLSVSLQTVPTPAVLQIDDQHRGAWWARNEAMRLADGAEWFAFLDDDDEWLPHHVETLLRVQAESGADAVWSRWELVSGRDPTEGVPWKLDLDLLRNRNYLPVTALVRASLVREVGGFPEPGTPAWPCPDCEDWGLWLRLLRAGAAFALTNEVTWRWHNGHGGNTGGMAHG